MGIIFNFRKQRKWYEDICEYYKVTPLEAEELGKRKVGRRPNLPASSTTHAVSGMTFEEIWAKDPRDTINSIHRFYKDIGAWATFRQCYYHRNINAGHFVKQFPAGSRICEYGSGVAPVCSWIVENVRNKSFDLTIADVESEHLAFAKWRLQKKINESNIPFGLEVLTILSDNLPLKGYYDLILILEVFEHLYNPYEVAVHLARHLRPGGILCENYLICDPQGANLTQAQRDRPLVFQHLKRNFKLIKGRDPNKYPGESRYWKKL